MRHSALAEICQPWLVVFAQQNICRLEIAMQHAFAVTVIEPHANFAEHRHGFGDRHGSSIGEFFLKRTPRHKLHHVKWGIAVPADFQDLNDVAIGRKLNQILHFVAQKRPIHAPAMKKKLDRDRSSGVQIPSDPDLSERAAAQKPFQPIPWNVGRRRRRLHRELFAARATALGLVLRLVFVAHSAALACQRIALLSMLFNPLPVHRDIVPTDA